MSTMSIVKMCPETPKEDTQLVCAGGELPERKTKTGVKRWLEIGDETAGAVSSPVRQDA